MILNNYMGHIFIETQSQQEPAMFHNSLSKWLPGEMLTTV